MAREEEHLSLPAREERLSLPGFLIMSVVCCNAEPVPRTTDRRHGTMPWNRTMPLS